MFAVLEGWKGEPCLVVKVGKPALSLFLADPRSFQAPYIGKHGWVSLRRDAAQDWEEIGELVRASHELVSGKPKRG
jgi:predicted DNA-binding protein (MmcQ/YjbR family)